MVYMYIVKHNYILGSMLTNTKAQLHVSAISVGRLQVVHEELINKLYQRVRRGSLQVVGLGGYTHPTPQPVNSPQPMMMVK